MRRRLAIAVAIAVMAVPRIALAQSRINCPGVLSEQQLTGLITANVSEARVIEYVRQCGISFALTADSEARLRRAGAKDPVISAVRAAAPKPKPPAPEAKKQTPASVKPPKPEPATSELALRAEIELWNTIKDIRQGDVFSDYLKRYPQGQFAAPARARIREIKETEIEQALKDRRWDAADRGITALLSLTSLSPDDDKLTRWRKTIAESRSADRAETELWTAIKDTRRIDAFVEYLKNYPQGQFVLAARAKISDLAATEIEQALQDRRWDNVETEINILVSANAAPAEERLTAWRKAITDGRELDRRQQQYPQEYARLKFEFVKISPGEFAMGCSAGDGQCKADENPPHRVRITRPFEIGKYEVTQAQWEIIMGNNPSSFKGANPPVENVSWEDVQQFLQRLSARRDGYRYRLPTEAEWEYAARAGANGPYGGPLDQVGWYDGNSGNQNHPVGQKQPNAWGLYDVHGNVWEWVQDWYGDNYYRSSDIDDPTGPSTGQYRGLRGGSWGNSARNTRVSYRVRDSPTSRNGYIGFRCVREAIP